MAEAKELILPIGGKINFISSTAEIVEDGGEKHVEVTETMGETGNILFHFTFYNICGKEGKDASIVEEPLPENVTYDFKGATENYAIQGKVDRWNELTVDATAQGAKLAVRAGNWAQFNAGCIITVTVKAECVLTVSNYDTNYSVDGTAATTKEQEFRIGKEGKVNIVATANSYIGSIKVEYDR